MDPRLQLRVQRYGWDAAAEYYDDGWSSQLKPAHDTLLSFANLKPGQSVLETACGTGLVTRRVADAVGPTGSVLATDLSENMVEEMRKLASKNAFSNIDARRINAESLDVQDASFDQAICALGLMYVPDPCVAVTEMARCVKPGGTVSATVWGERRNCGWAEVFPIVDARVASEVCPVFFATGGQGVLIRYFEEAGLRQIKERRQTESLHFTDADEAVTSVLLGGPVSLAVKRFPEETWAEVRAEFLASIADYQTSGGHYDIPGEFVTVSGEL